jgi:hypothetical protein
MRKRLVALLSLVGFAGSSTPATSQVLKGSSATPETKTESQVKGDKVSQENAAAQNDTSKKMRKAGGEQQANKDVVTEKVGPDQVKTEMKVDPSKLRKTTAENTAAQDAAQNKKFVKSSAETKAGKTEQKVKLTNADAASKDASKMTKATTENTAIQDSQIKKVKTATGESNAVQSDIGKKAHKNQQDALTVKQKVATAGKIKLQKNAAESNAAQKSAHAKFQKQTGKATPK